jgi:hypothetical protein
VRQCKPSSLAYAVSGGQALGSGESKGQQSIDDRGLAPLRSSMASPWSTNLVVRARKEPPAKGGWNLLHTWWQAADVLNPAIHFGLSRERVRRFLPAIFR